MVVVYPERKKIYHRINLHDGGEDPYVMKSGPLKKPQRTDDHVTEFEADDLLKAAHKRKQAILIEMVWKTAIIGAALATLLSNIYALLIYGGFVQFIACSFASAASLAIAYIEVTNEGIEKDSSLTLKEVRTLAIGYARENAKLEAKERELKVKLFCKQEAESRLKFIVRGQKYSTRAVIDIVTENHRLINELKLQARCNMAEELLSTMYLDDKVEHVTDRAISNLLRNIRKLPSLIVNDRRWNKLSQGKTAEKKLLDMAHCLLSVGLPTRERIFIFDDEDEELQRVISGKLYHRKAKKDSHLIEAMYGHESISVPLNDEVPTRRSYTDLMAGRVPRGRGSRPKPFSRPRSTSPSQELKIESNEPKRGRGLFGNKSMPKMDRKKFFAAARREAKDDNESD